MNKHPLEIILQIMQIIIVPLTFLISFFSFKKVIQSNAIAKDIDKAKFTNQFVSKFQKIIANFDSINLLKDYYYSEIKLLELQEYINNQDILKFDKNYYLQLLKTNKIERETVQKLISDAGKKENNFDQIVDFCCNINVFSDDFLYHKYYSKYLSLLEDVEANDKFTEEQKQKHIEIIQLLFIRTLSEKETNLLNELECLCLNTKFGLINYKVIYNLIIHPFEWIIKQNYLELMEAILTNEENGYQVFSNIVNVYDELMKIKNKRFQNMTAKAMELKTMNSDKDEIY